MEGKKGMSVMRRTLKIHLHLHPPSPCNVLFSMWPQHHDSPSPGYALNASQDYFLCWRQGKNVHSCFSQPISSALTCQKWVLYKAATSWHCGGEKAVDGSPASRIPPEHGDVRHFIKKYCRSLEMQELIWKKIPLHCCFSSPSLPLNCIIKPASGPDPAPSWSWGSFLSSHWEDSASNFPLLISYVSILNLGPKWVFISQTTRIKWIGTDQLYQLWDMVKCWAWQGWVKG